MDILASVTQAIKELPSNKKFLTGDSKITFEYVITAISDITLKGVDVLVSAGSNNTLKIEASRVGSCSWAIGKPLNEQSKQTVTFFSKLFSSKS